MKNILFTLVKATGIIYTVTLFSAIGYLNASIIDYTFYEEKVTENEKKKYTKIDNGLAVLKLTISAALLCYIGRNIAEAIPFIFENIQGFKFALLKEVKSGSIMLFFTILFSSSFHSVLDRIKNKE